MQILFLENLVQIAVDADFFICLLFFPRNHDIIEEPDLPHCEPHESRSVVVDGDGVAGGNNIIDCEAPFNPVRYIYSFFKRNHGQV